MGNRIRILFIVAVLAALFTPALASAQGNCQIYWQNATSMPVEAGSTLPLTYRTQGCSSAQDIRLVHGETEIGRANGTLDIHFTVPKEAGQYSICPQLLISGNWATVNGRCIELKVENHQATQAPAVVAPTMTLAANAQQANVPQSTPGPQSTLSLTDTNQGGGSNKAITTVTVSVWKLNIRQTADTTSALMGAVYQKDVLTYNFSNSDGTWFNITAPNGLTGWVMSKFVSKSGVVEIRQTPTPAPQAIATEGVGQSYLNVGLQLTDIPKDAKFVFAPKDVLIRKGPGEAFPVIAQADAGYYLLWVNQVGSWIQVKVPNGTGWVSAWSTTVATNDGKQTMIPPNPTAVPTAIPTASFSPTPEFANDGTCGTAPTANLVIGKKGQSTPQGGNINVRDNPAGNKLGWKIPELAVFDVIDGPACSQNFWWWKVTYQGQSGWIAAGDVTNGAYVVPVG